MNLGSWRHLTERYGGLKSKVRFFDFKYRGNTIILKIKIRDINKIDKMIIVTWETSKDSDVHYSISVKGKDVKISDAMRKLRASLKYELDIKYRKVCIKMGVESPSKISRVRTYE